MSRDGRWALATKMVRFDSDLMRLDNFRVIRVSSPTCHDQAERRTRRAHRYGAQLCRERMGDESRVHCSRPSFRADPLWSNDPMRLAPGLVFGLVVAAAVTAGACSEGQVLQPQQRGAGPAAVPVTVTTAVQKSMPLDAGVVGTVEAYSTVSVCAQITGELTAVNFKQGDDVTAGQELFLLDCRPLEAALLQAQRQSRARHRGNRERQGDRPALRTARRTRHRRA